MALRRLSFAITILSSTAGVAQQNVESPATRELLSMTVNPNSDFSRSGRAKFVRILSNYCREFLSALPTNTPKEDTWIASEMKTSDMAKIRRLASSPEFSRQRLKDTFSTCEETTRKIIDAISISDRTESVVRYEAAYLTSLAITFNESSDIEVHASKAGINTQSLGIEFLGSVRRALLFSSIRTLEGK